MPNRQRLPSRRRSETFTLFYQGHNFVITFGELEVFVNAEKVSTPLDAAIRDAAILVSIALQYGAPYATLKSAMTREADGSPASAIGAVLDAIHE